MADAGALLVAGVRRWRARGERLIRRRSAPGPPRSRPDGRRRHPRRRWDVIVTGLGIALRPRAWGESVTVRDPDPGPPVHSLRRMS